MSVVSHLPPAEQHRLILENRAFVFHVARQIPSRMSLEEKVAHGDFGMVEAARRFNPAVGVRFTTYAGFWIRAMIFQAITKDEWSRGFVRLDHVCNDAGEEIESDRLDHAELVTEGSQEQEAIANIDGATVDERMGEVLKFLRPRERRVIHMRYLSSRPKTLQDIATQWGLSRERVRQIEEIALRRLKAPMMRYVRKAG